MGSRSGWLGLGLLAAAWPSDAHAINGARPRVPPSFYGQACITVAGPDAPLIEIGLTVPYADTDLTEDELADSRTLQLFAFDRDLPPGFELPTWVSEDDVMRSLDAGILDVAPDPLDVLSGSAWAEGAVELVSTEERLPIACESAGPWPWSIEDARTGAYVVWGYTFEPPLNLWTPRPGVVRVVDAVGAGPPAVALTGLDRRLEFGRQQGLAVTGCLSADAGTEVELSWARAAEPELWTSFDRVVPEDGTFEVVLQPPEDTLYQALYVRAEAIDPQGRSFVHHARGALVVLDACVEDDVGPATVDDACGVAVDGTGDGRIALPCDGPPAEDVAEDEDPDEPSSQGCTLTRPGRAPWLMFAVWGLLVRRSRKNLGR